MKNILLLSTFLIIFTACSNKNAFSMFDMNKEQELAASSLQSSKMMDKEGETTGIVSVVYLNEVYPYYFSGNEYFFVYMYVKDSKKFEDATLNITMNGEQPLKIKKLAKTNNFTHLVNVKSDWNKYYLVTFTKSSGDNINLSLESSQSSSAGLMYQKDTQ